MADFKNPLRTQTGAAFDPTVGPRSKSKENLVNAVIKGGEHIFEKAKTEQISNVVDTQAADFLAQPDRLRAARAEQDQLTLETGGDPRQRDYPLIKDLNTNINKLKDAFNAGAIDSTHLLARAKSALRGAIAQNPVLADQLRATVARRLGDYAPDLQIADQELTALTAPDKEAARLEQQKYDHLQKLAEGYGYYLDNKEHLDNFATQFGPVIFKAASLQHQLELSKNGKAISDLEVQKHAPAWVSQKFVETTGKFDQLLRDSSLSDEEKLRRIRAVRAAFSAQVDSSLGAHLSSTEIEQRMAATNQMFDMYEQAALHEDRRTIAKNLRDSYIYTVSSRALANPDVANLAVATDLFGAFFGNLAAIDKGVRKPLDGIYDVIKDMSTGRTLTPDDVTKAKEEGVFTSVLKTIPERVDAGMWSTDKAQSVMEKFVKSITSPDTSLADPDEQKLMMQGVSIMATPEFRKALEKVDTSSPRMHNFALRVQQYIGDTVVPWFSRRIDNSIQYYPSTGNPKATNLLQVTTPVWGANGKVYLSIEQDRIPPDASGDPSFLPNLRAQVERFNTSPYVLGWNNAMAASATLSGRTTEEVSKSAWENVFGGGFQNSANSADIPKHEKAVYDYNKQWAKPGPYYTKLKPDQERQFRQWVEQNDVNFNVNNSYPDYDMRGFWKALQNGDPRAQSAVNPVDHKIHFPDKWKTPYDRTFSRESKYATPDAPHWGGQDGQQLFDNQGRMIFDQHTMTEDAPPPRGGSQ